MAGCLFTTQTCSWSGAERVGCLYTPATSSQRGICGRSAHAWQHDNIGSRGGRWRYHQNLCGAVATQPSSWRPAPSHPCCIYQFMLLQASAPFQGELGVPAGATTQAAATLPPAIPLAGSSPGSPLASLPPLAPLPPQRVLPAKRPLPDAELAAAMAAVTVTLPGCLRVRWHRDLAAAAPPAAARRLGVSSEGALSPSSETTGSRA